MYYQLFAFAVVSVYGWPQGVYDLPDLILLSDSSYLSRRSETLMQCVIHWQNANISGIRLSRVEWMKDGMAVNDLDKSKGAINIEQNGPILRVLRGKRQSEGDYQCSALVQNIHLPTGARIETRLVSAPVRFKRVRLSRFDRAKKEHVVSAIQGHIARLPCLGIPDSIPGPAIVWFERTSDSAIFTQDGAAPNSDRFLVTWTGLQIAVVQPHDSGRYHCAAKNPHTNQTRQSRSKVHLVVDDRPSVRISESFIPRMVFPRQRDPVTMLDVVVGRSALLECVVAGGKVVWEKVNASLPVSLTDRTARVRQIWGNLLINDVSFEDAGKYICHGLSPIAADLSDRMHPRISYRLNVYAPTKAKITLQKEAQQPWVLSCLTQNVVWEIPMVFVNGSSLIESSNRLGISHSANLYINPVNVSIPKLSGSLQCLSRPAMSEAEIYGSGVEQGHSVNVYVQVESDRMQAMISLIETGPENATRQIGSDVQLPCFVPSEHLHLIFVEWHKDGELMVMDERLQLVGTATLDIGNIRKSDQGWYTCVVYDSDANRSVAKAFLHVEDLISSEEESSGSDAIELPSSLETNVVTPGLSLNWSAPLVFVSDRDVRLQWSTEQFGSREVYSFKIELRRRASKSNWIVGDQLEGHVKAYTLHQLVHGKQYQFRIEAIFSDSSVISLPTDWIEIEESAILLSIPRMPMIESLKALSPFALLLRWSYSDVETTVDAFEIGYKVYYDSADNDETLFETLLTSSKDREHIIDSLLPLTSYQVYVVAINSAVRSPNSPLMKETTMRRIVDIGKMENTTKGPIDTTDAHKFTILSLLSDWDTRLALLLLASLLVLLILMLCCCIICCNIKQRKADKAAMAAKGKFVDTSHRIFREQSYQRSKVALYQDSLSRTLAASLHTNPMEEADEYEPLKTENVQQQQTASIASLRSFPMAPSRGSAFPNLYGDTVTDFIDTSFDGETNAAQGIVYTAQSANDSSSYGRYSPASDVLLAPNLTSSSPNRLHPYHQTLDALAQSSPSGTLERRVTRPASDSGRFTDAGSNHSGADQHKLLHTFKPNSRQDMNETSPGRLSNNR